MQRKNNRLLILILVGLFIIIITAVGLFVYRSKQKSQDAGSGISYKPSALMVVTSQGGLCAGPCEHQVYNLYDSGKFEGYKKLSREEVSKLKEVIESTDFLKYGPNPNPRCESFVDGSDQVLLFPQKYGDKTFTPCMMDIPANDTAFMYINSLLRTHYKSY